MFKIVFYIIVFLKHQTVLSVFIPCSLALLSIYIFFHVWKLSDYLISFQNPSLKCILSLFFPTTFLQTVTHDQLVCLRPVETFKPYMFITIFEGHYVYYWVTTNLCYPISIKFVYLFQDATKSTEGTFRQVCRHLHIILLVYHTFWKLYCFFEVFFKRKKRKTSSNYIFIVNRAWTLFQYLDLHSQYQIECFDIA